MTIREGDVSHLVSMGFPVEQARNAMRKTGGDLQMAIDHILSGGCNKMVNDDPISSLGTVAPRSNTAGSMVRGSTSQYSYGNDGRSACTCIALTAADLVANFDTTKKNSESGSIITTELLDRSIEEGVARYKELRRGLPSSVEHLSADEVLQKDDKQITSTAADDNNIAQKRLFDIQLHKVGGGQSARQGLLSEDVDHPLGMKVVLEGLVNDIRQERQNLDRQKELESCSDGKGYTKASNHDTSPLICILLTKSPETVLLCLPAPTYEHDINISPNNWTGLDKKQYWLIDSHPRPRVETIYAKAHSTFDSLIQSLRGIFPFTDLGPDVPVMMSEMYNMFDLYALEGRKSRFFQERPIG